MKLLHGDTFGQPMSEMCQVPINLKMPLGADIIFHPAPRSTCIMPRHSRPIPTDGETKASGFRICLDRVPPHGSHNDLLRQPAHYRTATNDSGRFSIFLAASN
uniref:Uncharacterized protein n=1 Tax=Branchiostoma floridae TaxID=7739 RepID=C3ZGL0_BRAFL|eukprot:XP_002592225.1 hypothetical protein BRAFLDRAFT_70962 [Branchiostoma floridae]